MCKVALSAELFAGCENSEHSGRRVTGLSFQADRSMHVGPNSDVGTCFAALLTHVRLLHDSTATALIRSPKC
ncbi:MAG: hypothetical protein JWP89_245 [Schlesneria sp.]|nr:hypothetical protein [Schlesneria sp.]